MHLFFPVIAFAAGVASQRPVTNPFEPLIVPNFSVTACPQVMTISYNKSVPNMTDFPLTLVDMCYSKKSIEMTFFAYNETNFYFNASQGTNDDIWQYEVMEAFISKGTEDPQTYLEFEVNPNNVTYQAFVYNPSMKRAPLAPFDHFFVSDPPTDGFSATTVVDKKYQMWKSNVVIPLALFNVHDGKAKGTQWRMNFFRTVVSKETFPDQLLGGWSPPDQANFHITRFFGKVTFV